MVYRNIECCDSGFVFLGSRESPVVTQPKTFRRGKELARVHRKVQRCSKLFVTKTAARNRGAKGIHTNRSFNYWAHLYWSVGRRKTSGLRAYCSRAEYRFSSKTEYWSFSRQSDDSKSFSVDSWLDSDFGKLQFDIVFYGVHSWKCFY